LCDERARRRREPATARALDACRAGIVGEAAVRLGARPAGSAGGADQIRVTVTAWATLAAAPPRSHPQPSSTIRQLSHPRPTIKTIRQRGGGGGGVAPGLAGKRRRRRRRPRRRRRRPRGAMASRGGGAGAFQRAAADGASAPREAGGPADPCRSHRRPGQIWKSRNIAMEMGEDGMRRVRDAAGRNGAGPGRLTRASEDPGLETWASPEMAPWATGAVESDTAGGASWCLRSGGSEAAKGVRHGAGGFYCVAFGLRGACGC
jgi:hypothetical protein